MKKNGLDEGKIIYDGKAQAFTVHYDLWKKSNYESFEHWHEYIEILYCDDGDFSVVLNGKECDFSVGDMVVINSRETHLISKKSKDTGGYICIKFLPEILYTSSAAAFDIKYVMPFILNNLKHQRVFKNEELKDTLVPELVNDILKEENNKKYGYELAIRANISLIFLWIIRYWDENNADILNSGTDDIEMIELIEGVCEYVNKNYNDDIKASEMADMCNLSYSYFSRKFKQYLKKSFSEYLSYIRVVNAQRLLVSTDKLITDIAIECGFSATSYFIKRFKEYNGISPKQYRKRLTK